MSVGPLVGTKVETRAKVAQYFGSGRTLVLSRSLMKRLESSLLEQITFEKVSKLLAIYLSSSLMKRLESSWFFT